MIKSFGFCSQASEKSLGCFWRSEMGSCDLCDFCCYVVDALGEEEKGEQVAQLGDCDSDLGMRR